MINQVQSGNTLTLPAPANVIAGNIAVIGSIYGVAASSASLGQPVDLQTHGVFTLPKVAALGIAIGDKVYWDNTASLITKTASGNTLVGVAVTSAGNPSATVNVRLNSSF